MRSIPRRSAVLLVAMLALVATACGDEGSSADTAAPVSEPATDLTPNDDIRLTEILDVTSGDATTLAATATGDRPVLLWLWAPH
jgi:hypothetical protein